MYISKYSYSQPHPHAHPHTQNIRILTPHLQLYQPNLKILPFSKVKIEHHKP